MSSLLTAAFWLTALLVVYPYLVYPFLLRLLARIAPASTANSEGAVEKEQSPYVTLVISAFNEEATIARKLENALALDYPADRFEVIVVSDASFDLTDEIVLGVAATDGHVRLVRQEERCGKSAGLNLAVAASHGEIIVFSDANAMYETDAIQRLVAGFVDPTVGYVVGAALYYRAEGKQAAESEGLYWRLEMSLKRFESDYYSVVGGDGAIYAIRRNLFWELADDDISDFVNPLQIVSAGYRGLFNPAARCYEHAGETFEKEFRRKRRIVNRTWRGVCRYSRRLSIRKHGRFLFMLISHKVIRWYGFPLIILAWIANTALLSNGGIYVFTWLAITGSAVAAVYGGMLDYRGRSQPRLISVLYYFYSVNLAGLLGIWDEWRGVRHATWDHIRKTEV